MSNIGLKQEDTQLITEKLNVLLADFQVYYQTLRGLHWNIRGKEFFELHLKYEELYNEAALAIDTAAERILTLGGTPAHTFSNYLQNTALKEGENITNGATGVRWVVEALQTMLGKERELLTIVEKAGDEGTNAFLSDLITAQEKHVWMLTAYLS